MLYARLRRAALVAAVATATLAPSAARAQRAAGTVLDESAPPGPNYDKAEFRLWMPPGSASVRGTLVLVPGSNGDGRAMAEDSVWQGFAAAHHLAIVACRFTDKPHDQNFIEEYVNVSHGSGQALLDALSRFGVRSNHPELNGAPLLFWGMSAGGQFDYEFAAWKPERVIAFVVNKGGIYYTALTSQATRNVPAMLFVGGKDLEFRTNTIVGLFAVNRRGGALCSRAPSPGRRRPHPLQANGLAANGARCPRMAGHVDRRAVRTIDPAFILTFTNLTSHVRQTHASSRPPHTGASWTTDKFAASFAFSRGMR